MRIIAGRYRGRRLAGPTGDGVRPTSDRLRETLFNVLGERPVDARVLDAFAGTGALGLEALSRGAAHVTFVERDRRALAVLARNVAACGADEACATIRDDFLGVHARRPNLGPFDLLLLDPPYAIDDLEAVLTEAAGLAGDDAMIVLECSRRRSPPDAAGGFARRRTLTAGDSALVFYTAEAAGHS